MNNIKKYSAPNNFLRHLDRKEFLTPFDKFFDDFFVNSFPDISKELGVGFFEKQSFPKVDIIDYDDKIDIEAEIPGLSKDDVDVSVSDNVLTITGKKSEPSPEDSTKRYIRKELKHSSFKRSFTLGENIDVENLSAKFEYGLLTISLQKVKPVKPKTKKIQIK